ncbi:MAG TPA: hypothetical protein VJN02_11565 [Gammaproteobacteria bacterium]|nr:hypothetical protein [Gammaproteobacteria bacterium]
MRIIKLNMQVSPQAYYEDNQAVFATTVPSVSYKICMDQQFRYV